MRKLNLHPRLVLGRLATALLLGLVMSFGAMAGSDTKAADNPCAKSVINADEAKEIASQYMAELGYNEHAPGSTWHFSLRDSTCVNGQWRVNVDLGPHTSIKKKRMVLVNCQTGEVDDHFAEGDDLVAK